MELECGKPPKLIWWLLIGTFLQHAFISGMKIWLIEMIPSTSSSSSSFILPVVIQLAVFFYWILIYDAAFFWKKYFSVIFVVDVTFKLYRTETINFICWSETTVYLKYEKFMKFFIRNLLEEISYNRDEQKTPEAVFTPVLITYSIL